ncbi:hypothetical protein KSP39_PZI012529 [Platanthera zijinensis]|uniref:Phytocyanin domain-containing protein n=1 Tax=Platanthera zijinensis TaxID=2320716 RepID=A0AAP0BG91_9ASPA
MASKLSFFIAVAVLPAIVSVEATNFLVGEDDGWSLGVNFAEWAEGKQFKVGDTLVFQYKAVEHDVFSVSESDFNSCTAPVSIQHLLPDTYEITLTSPGRKWYICGKGNHCQSGMKLSIDVIAETDAPSPSPAGEEGNSAAVIAYPYGVIVLVASLAMVIMH